MILKERFTCVFLVGTDLPEVHTQLSEAEMVEKLNQLKTTGALSIKLNDGWVVRSIVRWPVDPLAPHMPFPNALVLTLNLEKDEE